MFPIVLCMLRTVGLSPAAKLFIQFLILKFLSQFKKCCNRYVSFYFNSEKTDTRAKGLQDKAEDTVVSMVSMTWHQWGPDAMFPRSSARSELSPAWRHAGRDAPLVDQSVSRGQPWLGLDSQVAGCGLEQNRWSSRNIIFVSLKSSPTHSLSTDVNYRH